MVIGVIIAWSAGFAHAQNANYSPLYGQWCGAGADDYWTIERGKASQMEESCTVSSPRKKGNSYTLKRTCEGFADEKWQGTTTFKLVRKNEIVVEGRRYRRC